MSLVKNKRGTEIHYSPDMKEDKMRQMSEFYNKLKSNEVSNANLLMSDEDLEESSRFVYLTKDNFENFFSSLYYKSRTDEAKLLWEILSQSQGTF
mmetsp:Transcript_106633/g.229619  ORF Transcript_106633/g.229619 Transcript_106633/m.229619 type:complete len:95 (-) Transcript_106633:12-296(-)